MPRPKGSKNRKTAAATALDLNVVEEKISAITTEIKELDGALKAKKTELKALVKAKAEAEAAAAAKKAEEDRARILEAVKNSGKSVEEILEFLK